MKPVHSPSSPLVVILGEQSKHLATTFRRTLGDNVEVQSLALDAQVRERPAVAVIEFDTGATQGLQAVARLHAAIGDLPIVVVAPAKDPDLILKAMRAGAREFVLASDEKAQAAAVREFLGRSAARGQVMTCFSTRGGVGSTSISTNLAGALAQTGRRVVLVDLEFQTGNVGLYLDVDVKYCIADVLRNLERLDSDLLLSSMARHHSGVYVLSQIGSIEDAANVSPQEITRLIDFLRRSFDAIVIDGIRGVDERSLAVVEKSDVLLMLVTQEMAAVKNAQFVTSLLHRLGYDEKRIRVVVNRYGMKAAALTPDAIADFVKLPIASTIADEYATLVKAVKKGSLVGELTPRSRLWEDISELGSALVGEEPKKKGLLRSLFGGGTPKSEPSLEPIDAGPKPERKPAKSTT